MESVKLADNLKIHRFLQHLKTKESKHIQPIGTRKRLKKDCDWSKNKGKYWRAERRWLVSTLAFFQKEKRIGKQLD
jgi:hypothetical protein